ncbi:hypothetical protein BB402_01550 [Helicobacter pylori]|nr:hypothetical protein BB402_01550 [Helicobacter pylori]
MLNIGCKSVKSVFKIQLKAFKGNAKKQKMTQFFQNYKKKKKTLSCYNTPMFNTSKYSFQKRRKHEKNPFTLSLSLVFAPR